jgi:DNA polymerase-3 subunit gamma/tau
VPFVSTALYRRYRPETFAEVIGQEHVTVPLMAALTKDRVNHAYLFSGPRGCGKTTSARILARCLNCAQGPTGTPCGVCESCVDLARGGPGSLDVVEIDAASHGGVDDARSLRERAAFAPARDTYKVFIIDEAHMVSTQGFNALLKIVEEPPPHVRFVFATTEPEKVIGTIRSRTHHYPFRLVPPERLQAYLAELCAAEGVSAGQGVLPLVVRAGAGSVRDSLSVLDQLIAGAGDAGLTYPLAVSLLGYTDAALLDEVVDGLAAGDGRAVFGVVDRVIESGHDPRRFVEDLLERMRDLLVVAAVPDGGHGVLRGLPADQFERMKGQAARFGRAELSRSADVVNSALTEMTGATSPRLQLELLCARLLLPGSEDTERGLRARVDRIEKRIGVAASGVPLSAPVGAPSASSAAAPVDLRSAVDVRAPVHTAAVRSTPVQAAPVHVATQPRGPGMPSAPAVVAASPAPAQRPAVTQAEAGSTPGGGVETVRRMWPDVMEKLRTMRRMTWTLVSEYAQVLDLDSDRLVLLFDSPGRASSFGRGSHAEFVRQALIEVIGLDCRIEAAAGDAGQARAAMTPPSAPAPVPAAAPPAAAPPPAAPPATALPTEPPPVPAAAPPTAPAAIGDLAPVTEQPSAAPPAEPPGWGPVPDRPPAARPQGDSPSASRPQRAPAPQSRKIGERPAGARPPGSRPAGPRRGPSASPAADYIRLPRERPADEPPPEDDFDPYARPAGPLSAQRPEQGAARPSSPPEALPAAQPTAPGASTGGVAGASLAGASGGGDVPASAPASRYAALRATAKGAAASGARVSDRPPAPEDEPSADDPDIEGSGLVGPSVVAQLLGGRVIEERNE